MMSLPTRERGLKCSGALSEVHTLQSLPTRERGLKCFVIVELRTEIERRSLRGSVD